MEITIIINGIEIKYKSDYDTLRNNNWNEIIGDRLDSMVSEKNKYEMPGFEDTMNQLDNLDIHGE